MKAGVYKIPALTAGQYVYLFRPGTRLPTGDATPEIADIFFVKQVAGPLAYRGVFLGTDGTSRLLCERNRQGNFHVIRTYKGEKNTIHYDIMRHISEKEAVAFIEFHEKQIRGEAKSAEELIRGFQRAKLVFLTAARTFQP